MLMLSSCQERKKAPRPAIGRHWRPMAGRGACVRLSAASMRPKYALLARKKPQRTARNAMGNQGAVILTVVPKMLMDAGDRRLKQQYVPESNCDTIQLLAKQADGKS